jgi:O-antigen/teichoic acid export membrane protein
MLGFMKTKTDVGYYNAAVKIKTILVSIVTSLGSVLLPRASYYVEKKQMEEFRRITEKALTFVLLLAAPMTVYFILFASNGIYFLSGSAYTQSIVPMQIIMPTLLFIGLTNILGIQIMVPLGKRNMYSIPSCRAAVDFALNWLLIPRFSSAGRPSVHWLRNWLS